MAVCGVEGRIQASCVSLERDLEEVRQRRRKATLATEYEVFQIHSRRSFYDLIHCARDFCEASHLSNMRSK